MATDINALFAEYSKTQAPRAIRGEGTGKSDSVPAVLKDKQGTVVGPAALSDGEFVITAPAVSIMGAGSTEAGFRFFEDFMAGIENMDPEAAAELGRIILGLMEVMKT